MGVTLPRILPAILLTLGLALPLSACSLFSDTETIDESKPSTTPTPATSSSPPPQPTMPEQATQKTVDSAVSFVEYYYKLVQYGHLTDDWEPLKKLTGPNCQECPKFWSSDEMIAPDEGVYTEVGTPHMDKIQDNQIKVTIIIEVGAGLDGNSSEMERFERIEKTWQDHVNVAYKNGWKVVGIEPDQLRPSETCIANRCNDYQKQ